VVVVTHTVSKFIGWFKFVVNILNNFEKNGKKKWKKKGKKKGASS
jgi:hypothetical protein